MGPYNHVDFILFEPEKYVDSGVSEESVPPGPVLEDQHRFSPGETWLQLVLPCLPRGRLMFIACAILIYTIYIIYTYIYIYVHAYHFQRKCDVTLQRWRPGHGCLTFRRFETGQSSAEPPRTRLRSLLESFSAALNMNRRGTRIWCCHFLRFLWTRWGADGSSGFSALVTLIPEDLPHVLMF